MKNKWIKNKNWTNEEVLAIREDFKNMSYSELQAKYSITANQVSYAMYGYKFKSPKALGALEKIKRLFLAG